MLSAEEKDFEQECLQAHNQYRALHGVPLLKINPAITMFAKAWAQACAQSDNIVDRESEYGSNIYAAQRMEVDGEKVSKFWYDKIKKYDFNNPKFSTETGSFTQLIWKETSELGVGIAKRGENTYVIALYNKPGNVLGLFEENVPRTLTEQAEMPTKPKPKTITRDDEKEYERACLLAHNEFRAIHGVPPLTINPELTRHAKMWSEVCLKDNVMKHSGDRDYGENIYFTKNIKADAVMPVKAWYDEIKDYDYNNPKFSLDTGHFTQLIWKGTKEVGIAIAEGQNLTYVVANYKPPGNILGQFQENVPLPTPSPPKPLPMAAHPTMPSKAIPVKHPPVKHVPAVPQTPSKTLPRKNVPAKNAPGKPETPLKKLPAQHPPQTPQTTQSPAKHVKTPPQKPMSASPHRQATQKTVEQKHAAPQQATPPNVALQKKIPEQSALIRRQPTPSQAPVAQQQPVSAKGPATHQQPSPSQTFSSKSSENQSIPPKIEQKSPRQDPVNLLMSLPKLVVYMMKDKYHPNKNHAVRFRPFEAHVAKETPSVRNPTEVKSTQVKGVLILSPTIVQNKPAQPVSTQPNANVIKPAPVKSISSVPAASVKTNFQQMTTIPCSSLPLHAKGQNQTHSIQSKESKNQSPKKVIQICLLAPKDPTKPHPFDAGHAGREKLEAKVKEKERASQTKPIQSGPSQSMSGPPTPSQIGPTQAIPQKLEATRGNTTATTQPSLKHIASTEEIPEKVKPVQVKPSEIRSAEARTNQIKPRDSQLPPPSPPEKRRFDKGKLAETTRRWSYIKPPPRIVVRSSRVQPLPHGILRDIPEMMSGRKVEKKLGTKPIQKPAQKFRTSISQGDKTGSTRTSQGRIEVRAIKIQPPASHVVQVIRTYKPTPQKPIQSGKTNRHVGPGQEKLGKIVVRAMKVQPPPTHIIEITKTEKTAVQNAGQKVVKKSIQKQSKNSGKMPVQMKRGSQGESAQLKPGQGNTSRIVVRNINVKPPPVHVVQGAKIQKPIKKVVQNHVNIRWSTQGASSHVAAIQGRPSRIVARGINYKPSVKGPPPDRHKPSQERLSKIAAGNDQLRNRTKLPPPQFRAHVTQTAFQNSRSGGRGSTQSGTNEGEKDRIPFNLRARIIVKSRPPTT